MRFPRTCAAVVLALFFALPLAAQQTATTGSQSPERDPQAVALVQKSVAAMATNIPTDSSATGTVNIVEGSSNSNGTIEILTRGSEQTAETLNLPDGLRTLVYSNGAAKENNGNRAITEYGTSASEASFSTTATRLIRGAIRK